jgi:phage terminase large subunit GpA-like protein
VSAQGAAVLEAAVDIVRPLKRLSPSAFAETYRYLQVGKSHLPGPWRNENAPYLVDVMNAVEEAIRTGKRGVVLEKPSQVGGSEAFAINVVQWLLTYYPGPILYLTAIESNAEELSRDRWEGPEGAIATCEPLAKKHLAGKKHGEKVLVKRFTDSKLVLSGSQSIHHLISNPYRFVVVDEVDSINDFMDGDAIKIAEHRTRAWAEGGPTLIIAFAHPSTPERGAAKLYELSDRRRGHVECPHCHTWIAPTWADVKVIAAANESPAEAERIHERYHFVAPCCGVQWSEIDRRKAIRRVEQRSTLPAGTPARDWIGLHVWRFFSETKGEVAELAREWIDSLDDEAKARVFANKTLAEPWRAKVRELAVETWRRLQVPEGKDGCFALGEVPAEVQFLTAGQDSAQRELHWAVLGWGLARTHEKQLVLRGWLVDAGVEAGPRAIEERTELAAHDLHVFRQILYERTWPRRDGGKPLALARGLHDVGWQPIAVYGFCSSQKDGRAIPSRGGNYTDTDHTKAPPTRLSEPVVYGVGSQQKVDPNLRRLELNTYLLKTAIASNAEATLRDEHGVPRPILTLPYDAPDELLEHLASERVKVESGKRKWVKRGPNHWWDCTVMAYAAALNFAALVKPRTRAEARLAAQARLGQRRRRDGDVGAHAINTEY